MATRSQTRCGRLLLELFAFTACSIPASTQVETCTWACIKVVRLVYTHSSDFGGSQFSRKERIAKRRSQNGWSRSGPFSRILFWLPSLRPHPLANRSAIRTKPPPEDRLGQPRPRLLHSTPLTVSFTSIWPHVR